MAKAATTTKSSNSVKFNQVALHGRLRFTTDEKVTFEDTDAAPYFIKCGWADSYQPTDGEDVRFVTLGEIDIDPDTIHNESGLKVADLNLSGE